MSNVDKYFYAGFGDEEKLRKLESSNVFPLMRELQFKFDMKVVQIYQALKWGEPAGDRYLLCYPNGMAVATIWAVDNGGEKHNQVEYFFRTPYYTKARGRTNEDRETFSSIKIGSLMATLTRQKAIVPAKTIEKDRKLDAFGVAVRTLRSKMGNSSKDRNAVDIDDIHRLLKIALGENTDTEKLQLDLAKCKKALDIYNEADKVHATKMAESDRFFLNPFYMVGVDELGHYLIGKVKLGKVLEYEDCEPVVIEPFKRYKDIESYPELIPLMTMVKVAYETNSRKVGCMPILDKYDDGLDALFFYNNSPTLYDQVWMLSPCNI